MYTGSKRRVRVRNPETGVHLTICGVCELRDAIRKTAPDMVISITDPDAGSFETARRALEGYKGVLVRLEFHDVDGLRPNLIAPNLDIIRPAIERIKADLPENGHLLVHCAMGMSRSPAMAIIAMALMAEAKRIPAEEADDSIFSQVFDASPVARPNQRILFIGESLEPSLRGRLHKIGFQISKATGQKF